MVLTIVGPKLPVTVGKPIRITISTNTAQTIDVSMRRGDTTKIVYRKRLNVPVGKTVVMIPTRSGNTRLAPGRYKVILEQPRSTFG